MTNEEVLEKMLQDMKMRNFSHALNCVCHEKVGRLL